MSAKTREITITESKGAFSFFKKNPHEKKDFDFSGLSAFRQLLNNEKARMIYIIKNDKPSSIYDLAKKLGRNFKSVSDDIKLLQRFGFVQLVPEKHKGRTRHRPAILADSLTVHIKI